MNIVHVIFSLKTGGAQTLLVDLANIQSRSHNVSVVCINNEFSDALCNQFSSDVRLFLGQRMPGCKNPAELLRTWVRLALLKPEVVHCHDESAYFFVFPFKKITVLTIHSTQQLVRLENVSKFRHVASISKAVNFDLLKSGIHHGKIIYNGVKRVSKPIQRDLLAKNRIRIVQVGRLQSEIKGQDLLLNAAALLIHQYFINLEIDFIGDGPCLDELKQLSQRLCISDHIKFLGQLSRTELFELLPSYDVLIQPSRIEGFGLTIVEALFSGVPVIAADLDGPREILAPHLSELLFPAGDYIKLAECIRSFYQTCRSSVFQASLDEAIERALTLFDVEGTAKQYESLYLTM